MARRALLAGVAGGGIAVGAFTVHVVRSAPDYSFAGGSAGGAVALLGAGWVLIASGLVFAARRRASQVGLLLAGAGFAWFLLEWDSPQIGSALAFTIGLCLYAACPPLVAHAALAYPGGRVTSVVERAALVVGYGGCVLVLGLLPAMLSDPKAQGCGRCSTNLLLVADRPHAVHKLHRLGLEIGAGWASGLALLILTGLAGASAAARRARLPVATAAAAYLVLVAAVFAASVDRGLLWNGSLERRLWLGEATALVALTLAAAATLVRARRVRGAVARLVVDLERSPPPGGLRAVLAELVGDPALVLAYPLERSDMLVDAAGRPVDLAGCARRTPIVQQGRVAAVLGHAAGALDDRQLVEEVTAAARLALENERLQAGVRAQLERLRASRARIIEAGDAERTRLERNLHDGAQQRLVALSLSLRLLRSQLQAGGEVGARLDLAESELNAAIAELRELAHGIFPAVLADAGLAVAVRALAEDGRVPIRIGTLPESRYPPAVETAAYTIVAEVLRSAVGGLTVEGRYSDGTLVLEVSSDGGADVNVAGLADRVGALDGRLDFEPRADGGIRIRAELPCAS
jgi:signal transduction histidine kinase